MHVGSVLFTLLSMQGCMDAQEPYRQSILYANCQSYLMIVILTEINISASDRILILMHLDIECIMIFLGSLSHYKINIWHFKDSRTLWGDLSLNISHSPYHLIMIQLNFSLSLNRAPLSCWKDDRNDSLSCSLSRKVPCSIPTLTSLR